MNQSNQPSAAAITPVLQNLQIDTLTPHSWLLRFGIKTLTSFEISETTRLNLPHDCILVTEDAQVVCNWNAVELARKTNQASISVYVLKGLKNDEVPQVVSLKYSHYSTSARLRAELFVAYQEYLTENECGREWAKLIISRHGNKTINKIGELFGYAYGMVYGYIRLYKQAPHLLDKIDKGEMTFSEADKRLSSDKKIAEASDETDGDQNEPEDENEQEGGAAVGTSNVADQTAQSEETSSVQPTPPPITSVEDDPKVDVTHTSEPSIKSVPLPNKQEEIIKGSEIGKAGRYRSFEALAGIQIRYHDGKVLDLNLSDGVTGTLDGHELKAGIMYRSVIEVLEKGVGAQVHTISLGKATLQVSLLNIENLVRQQFKADGENDYEMQNAA